MGRRPYPGPDRKSMRDQILNKQAHIRRKDLPDGYPKEAADFVNKCLMREAHKRLGINGIDEVKSHPWFSDFNWEALRTKKMVPSYQPDSTKNNFDDRHVNKKAWNDTKEIEEHTNILRRGGDKKHMFDTYFYDKNKLLP